jgi:hypothetical protein
VTLPLAETRTLFSTDSPPYTPAGLQAPLADDDDFISTYTFEKFPLATVIDDKHEGTDK